MNRRVLTAGLLTAMAAPALASDDAVFDYRSFTVDMRAMTTDRTAVTASIRAASAAIIASTVLPLLRGSAFTSISCSGNSRGMRRANSSKPAVTQAGMR